jgi:Fis family transcriptional regulator
VKDMEMQRVIEGMDELFFKENEGHVWRDISDSMEKPLLEKLLRYTHWNQVQASKILGINRNTLRTKLKRHGLLRSF